MVKVRVVADKNMRMKVRARAREGGRRTRTLSWRPKRQPAPTFVHMRERVEYIKNWVVFLEDDEEYNWRNYGCLYLIRDKGILWRNFSQEMEKFIAFGNMQFFRSKSLQCRPELETFLEVVTKGPIQTTFDKDKDPGVLEPEGPELAHHEEQFPLTNPVSVKLVFEPKEESAARELQWHVQKFLDMWHTYEYDLYPKENELWPPSRFADADGPNAEPGKSRGKKIIEYMDWEARVEEYGRPLKGHRWGCSWNKNLFAKGFAASLDDPRYCKIFRAPPLHETYESHFDEIVGCDFLNLDPRNWWHKPHDPSTDETAKLLRVAAGRYDDAKSDTSMVCVKQNEGYPYEPTLSWTVIE